MEDTSQADDLLDAMCAQIRNAHPDADTDGFAVAGRVLLLATAVSRAREAVLAQFDISQADYDVLATLARHADEQAGLNPSTLRRSVTLTSGGLTKRLDNLERSGLVTRSADPKDRRGVIVQLTAEGRHLFARALPAVLQSDADLWPGALKPSDAAALVDLLRQLVRHSDVPSA